MLYRTRIISILLLSFSLIACKREKVKTKTTLDIYNQFTINNKATFFYVPPGIVSLFLDESQKGNKELKDLLADVNELTFLILNKPNEKSKDLQCLNELSGQLDSLDFTDLAQIKTSKEFIKVKVERKKRYFEELVVLVSNNDAMYCISFRGNIHPKKVVNLVKPENVVAVTNLDRFKQ